MGREGVGDALKQTKEFIMSVFFDRLAHWYEENRRSLPWRDIDNPYYIWISEVILQQTRVEQGTPYYFRFIEMFPTVKVLAEADEQTVLKCWQGLGYYTRARNLHAAAKQIMCDFGGVFPNTYDDIASLKGVGRYTAAAIASFAFGLPYPAIDGNVLRVSARLFGIFEPVNTAGTYKSIEEILKKHQPKEHAALFNHAMMDFGATFCIPQNPLCEQCCFADMCVANKQQKQNILPIKQAKVKPKDRYLGYLVMICDAKEEKKLFMNRRQGKDIWKNLFDFPLIYDCLEPVRKIDKGKVFGDLFPETTQFVSKTVTPGKEYLHILSHFRIHAVFYTMEINEREAREIKKQRGEWVSPTNLSNYPLPRLVDKYVKRLFNL